MADRNILYRLRAAIAGRAVALSDEVEFDNADATFAGLGDRVQGAIENLQSQVRAIPSGVGSQSRRAFTRLNTDVVIIDDNLSDFQNINTIYAAGVNKNVVWRLPSDTSIAQSGISYPITFEFSHLGGLARNVDNMSSNRIEVTFLGDDGTRINTSLGGTDLERIFMFLGDVVVLNKNAPGEDWDAQILQHTTASALLPSGVFELQTNNMIQDITAIETELSGLTIVAGDAFEVVAGGLWFGTQINPKDVIVALVSNPDLTTNSGDWLILINGGDSLSTDEVAFFNNVSRDGTRFDLSSDVMVNESNVISFSALATGTPLTLAYFTSSLEVTGRSVTFSDQPVQLADLIGGTLSLSVGFNASSFSGFLPELTSLVFNFSGTTFTFPINEIDAENGVGTIDIQIPNADYSSILNSNCDITLNYQYRGDRFVGSFTIAGLVNTLNGSLRQAITDIANNAALMAEQRLTVELNKLGSEIDDDGSTLQSIQPRLSPYKTVTQRSPEINAQFTDSTGSDAFPVDLTGFTQVSASNPRYTADATAMFVAVVSNGSHSLMNITQDTSVPLDSAQATVDLGESLSANGNVYFVYRVTGLTIGDVFEVEKVTHEQIVAWPDDIDNLQDDVNRIDAELEHALLNVPDEVVQVIENEVTVTEEDTPTIVATDYNRSLGNTNAQTVFIETENNAPSGGQLRSAPISAATGDRALRKLVYINPGATLGGVPALIASNNDGSQLVTLLSLDGGQYSASVLVPSVAESTVTDTIYPAPSNRVSGEGVWITVPALTFTNGVPVPEADEVFFERNLPSTSTTLTVQYRGHANGNLFGEGSITLAGVGGSSNVSTTFTINDGNESATVEVLWRASNRDIRVSVTERVDTGLPTINDVQVILSFTEQRTVPATPATTRSVPIENQTNVGQVFAIKPSDNNTVILVGSLTEIDTGFTYTGLFSSNLGGDLILNTEDGLFYDYEDFEPIDSTIVSLENRATLPQYGLFTTQYTHETIVDLATQLTVRDNQGNVIPVGVAQSLTTGERTAMTTANTQVGTIVFDTSINRFFGLRNGGWIQFHN
ncbi:hypothetical protein VPHD63_0009 [Vibrio phage D63]